MDRLNRVIGAVCLVFSIVLTLLAVNISEPPSATSDLLGPKAFPVGVGVLMIGCSIGIGFSRLPTTDERGESLGVRGLIRLLPYVSVLVLYVFLLPYLGMVVGICMLMWLAMFLTGKDRWVKDIIISGSVAIGVWVLFVYILEIHLPVWPAIF